MNHERPRGSTAKNWSPRLNYLVGGAWLLGLLGGRLAGMRQSYQLLVTLLLCRYSVLWTSYVQWYGMLLSLIMPAKCQVPSTLSSAFYDLLRINQSPMGLTGSQPSQVLIQADFSVPARMTADMTMEWKGVALENAPQILFLLITIVQRLGEDCPISWCQTGWYRGDGQVGYYPCSISYFIVHSGVILLTQILPSHLNAYGWTVLAFRRFVSDFIARMASPNQNSIIIITIITIIISIMIIKIIIVKDYRQSSAPHVRWKTIYDVIPSTDLYTTEYVPLGYTTLYYSYYGVLLCTLLIIGSIDWPCLLISSSSSS